MQASTRSSILTITPLVSGIIMTREGLAYLRLNTHSQKSPRNNFLAFNGELLVRWVLRTLAVAKRGHSSFLLLFAGFPTGFYGNMVLCQEPHELPSEGFATTF